MCHSREGIDAPKDSFNRWLLERRVIDQGKDPLLPSYCFPGTPKSPFQPLRLSVLPSFCIHTSAFQHSSRHTVSMALSKAEPIYL